MAEMSCSQLLLMNLLRRYCSRASYHAITSPGWVCAHLCIHASFKRISVTQSHVDISNMILCTCMRTYIATIYGLCSADNFIRKCCGKPEQIAHAHALIFRELSGWLCLGA